jgi:GNAT superfamily N-acetyltransferase
MTETSNKPSFIIRPAKEKENELLTDLALRSKSYWKYEQSYLSRCRPALHIDSEYIRNWPVMVLKVEHTIAGFYSLKNTQSEDRLDNLWIDLPFIGNGYGKIMLAHAMKRAHKMGWSRFRLAADPGAEKFYEKFGAKKLGVVQSKIKSDLFLPHLEIIFYF